MVVLQTSLERCWFSQVIGSNTPITENENATPFN
jgi:hypothetical protein